MKRNQQFCVASVTRLGILLTTPSIMAMSTATIPRHNRLTRGERNLSRSMGGRRKSKNVSASTIIVTLQFQYNESDIVNYNDSDIV